MGLIKTIKDYEEKQLRLLGVDYKGLTLLELGNQEYGSVSAKSVYEAQGVNHTSIDLNGRDGSLPLDLSSDITKHFNNKFDVITNYGTTEHVENQYGVFKNIHSLCKPAGGIMIHGVPLIDNWTGHCRYYYSLGFFKELSYICNYKIIDLFVLDTDYYVSPNNLVMAVLVKQSDPSFMSEQKFNSIKGLFDSGDKTHTQNYTN
jgi:hypothetical protein